MPAQIVINEIHPNPDSGNEWIELLLISEEVEEYYNLENFTVFDRTRQIYKFSNEQFNNQLLTIEVSGLNNDTDAVILKDKLGNIIDSFTYDKTEKGLSWSKKLIDNIFILTSPSRNSENLDVTPTLTTTPPLTITPTPTPTLVQILTQTPTVSPVLVNTVVKTTLQKEIQQSADDKIEQIYKTYDLNKIKLESHDQKINQREVRLVFIGKRIEQTEIINAIIGSFLIILSSVLFVYVKIKNQHH